MTNPIAAIVATIHAIGNFSISRRWCITIAGIAKAVAITIATISNATISKPSVTQRQNLVLLYGALQRGYGIGIL